MIDDLLWRVDAFPANPVYKATIETTWQRQQWLAQATTAEKTKFFD